MASYMPKRKTSEETNPVDTLIWNFQPQEREENKFCCVSHRSVVFCKSSPGEGEHGIIIAFSPSIGAANEDEFYTISIKSFHVYSKAYEVRTGNKADQNACPGEV